MNQTAFDVGVCGYCGAMAEYWESKHVSKCKKSHQDYLDSQNPVKLLERIAKSLEKQL